jgi:hypothetical protein
MFCFVSEGKRTTIEQDETLQGYVVPHKQHEERYALSRAAAEGHAEASQRSNGIAV